MNEILRRKLKDLAPVAAQGERPADHAWRLALVRAFREAAGLVSEMEAVVVSTRDLAELPELLPERGLIALLDGPGGAMGLVVFAPEVMCSLIEMQTTGRVSAAPPPPRRPTRTDAAMVCEVVDRALARFDLILREREDLPAIGFRYASFLEDARTLGLLLEDQPWRVSEATLNLADGARRGRVLLALPAATPGLTQKPIPEAETARSAAEISDILGAAECRLDAVLARLSLPLSAVISLQEGQVLQLQDATLERISIQGLDGKPLARARLGQSRGARALRLTAMAPALAAAERGGAAGHFGQDSLLAPLSAPLMAGAAPSPIDAASTALTGVEAFAAQPGPGFGADLTAGSDGDPLAGFGVEADPFDPPLAHVAI